MHTLLVYIHVMYNIYMIVYHCHLYAIPSVHMNVQQRCLYYYTNNIVEPRITAPQTKPCFIAVECPDAIASGINSRNDTLTFKKNKRYY